jgi:flagellar motor switch protein FliN/FliY
MNESDISHIASASSSQDTTRDIPSAQLLALSELHPPAAVGGTVMAAPNPLHQIKTKLQVCVGEASMTIGELLGAKEHQVVTLDRPIDQPVDLLLEGRVIARGQLVAVGDSFGIRLTELPLPLKV